MFYPTQGEQGVGAVTQRTLLPASLHPGYLRIHRPKRKNVSLASNLSAPVTTNNASHNIHYLLLHISQATDHVERGHQAAGRHHILFSLPTEPRQQKQQKQQRQNAGKSQGVECGNLSMRLCCCTSHDVDSFLWSKRIKGSAWNDDRLVWTTTYRAHRHCCAKNGNVRPVSAGVKRMARLLFDRSVTK